MKRVCSVHYSYLVFIHNSSSERVFQLQHVQLQRVSRISSTITTFHKLLFPQIILYVSIQCAEILLTWE